jgi:hypothetical protein
VIIRKAKQSQAKQYQRENHHIIYELPEAGTLRLACLSSLSLAIRASTHA